MIRYTYFRFLGEDPVCRSMLCMSWIRKNFFTSVSKICYTKYQIACKHNILNGASCEEQWHQIYEYVTWELLMLYVLEHAPSIVQALTVLCILYLSLLTCAPSQQNITNINTLFEFKPCGISCLECSLLLCKQTCWLSEVTEWKMKMIKHKSKTSFTYWLSVATNLSYFSVFITNNKCHCFRYITTTV